MSRPGFAGVGEDDVNSYQVYRCSYVITVLYDTPLAIKHATLLKSITSVLLGSLTFFGH